MSDEAARQHARGVPAQAVRSEASAEEPPPRLQVTRRNMLLFGLFVASALAFLYLVLPKLTGLHSSWQRISRGSPAWVVAAVVLEGLSFAGYVLLFRTVFAADGADAGGERDGTAAGRSAPATADARPAARISWRESYQITMAGLAATRLFAAAGAGGVALTAWALRRAGMDRRTVATRMVAFMALLYSVYLGTVAVVGFALWFRIAPGPAPLAMTLLPAVLASVALVALLALTWLPLDIERRIARALSGGSRLRSLRRRVAAVPAALAYGLRGALAIARSRRAGVLGALAWWGFDIAVLWACFHAFGGGPPWAVIVMAYFVGMVANLLPLPGGIGGVDGGMIGSAIALGVDPGLAVVAVLSYRGLAFWLPTIPGTVAYLQLRRTVARWRATIQRELDGGAPEQLLASSTAARPSSYYTK